SRDARVAVLVTVTVAPGTAAPCSSSTLPPIWPVSVCADTAVDHNSTARHATTLHVLSRDLTESSCLSHESTRGSAGRGYAVVRWAECANRCVSRQRSVTARWVVLLPGTGVVAESCD